MGRNGEKSMANRARDWFAQAEKDVGLARLAAAGGSHEWACFASQQAAEKAIKFGMKEVDVRVKGPGSGRESAITALQAAGLKVKSIEDITPLPHNGCRPKKRRRV